MRARLLLDASPCLLGRYIRDIGSLVYGPPVIISQRAQMEVAFLEATWKTLDPVGITNRWINHTIHPAQTPGAPYCCCEARYRLWQ